MIVPAMARPRVPPRLRTKLDGVCVSYLSMLGMEVINTSGTQ